MARKADLTNHLVVKALRWKEGDPTQFEVKDEARKGFYISTWPSAARRAGVY